MESFASFFQTAPDERFPQPDWEGIQAHVDELEISAPDENEVWKALATHWMKEIAVRLGQGYQIFESTHFVLLANTDLKKAKEVIKFLERSLEEVLDLLCDLAAEDPGGKCPVIVFQNDADYYGYLSHYENSDDASGSSGGVYLNRGYGHFALPSPDLRRYVSVMSHELSHAVLAHLGLPIWLDEAITAEVENAIAGYNGYLLDQEKIDEHGDYWTETRIQDFWSGESFRYADEGQGLSYHLARFVYRALRSATSEADVRTFIHHADYLDSGNAAALDILGLDLGDAVAGLLGEGNWTPTGTGPD
jgi:hypothetical protein